MTFAQLSGITSAFQSDGDLPKIEIVDDTLSSALVKAVVDITSSMRDTLRRTRDVSGPYPLTNTQPLRYMSADTLRELPVVISVTLATDDNRGPIRSVFLTEVACPDDPLEIIKRRHGLVTAVRVIYGDDFGQLDVGTDGTLRYILEEEDAHTGSCCRS